MPNCKIVFTSEVKCTVSGLLEVDRKALYNRYRFFVPTARFSPLYKMGRWNGYVSYFTEIGNTYISFLPDILQYLQSRNYEITYESIFKRPDIKFEPIDETFLSKYKWGKGHKLEGQPVMMFDHQVKVVNALLSNHHSITESATSSGKTLMCLAISERVKEYGKLIIVEPSADLTTQTADFFKQFGIKCGIVGLGLREFDNDVIVATWQTISSLLKKKVKTTKSTRSRQTDDLTDDEAARLKQGVVAVILDEAHQGAATEIFKIFTDYFKDIPLRWGLTGTVPKEKEKYYPLIASFGPVVAEVEAKELQDKGILAQCNISILCMEDKEKFVEYDDEIKYLTTNIDKIKFEAAVINNISSAGNTLVLVQRIDTGEKLLKEIEALGKEAVFLSGSDKSTERMKEYKDMQQSDNKIIIATAQIASTGLDIPRIFNMVYIDMGKSFVKTIQSIGRGLRTYTDKTKVNIFDICSSTKFSKRHTKERIKYYIEKKYPWQMINVQEWKKEDE